MQSPEVSILIVTHNSRTVLPACLKSIAATTTIAHEIILVDNASTDGTPQLVRRQFPQASLTENRQNTGFAAANNQASRLARGRYLLLLNPDTVVHFGAIDRLVRYLDDNPQAGICAPRTHAVNGRIRYNCFAFETPWSFFWFGVAIGPLNRLRRRMLRSIDCDITANQPQMTEAVTGGAMLIRQALFESLDGFDERFFMYCEDGDLCLRAQQHGFLTILLPEATITHVGGSSTPQGTIRLNGMIGRHLLYSRYNYTRKYWGDSTMWGLRLAYGLVGAGFVLTSKLIRSPQQRTKLFQLGKLLYYTSPPQMKKNR
jgi:N-acetylglucosaminyl-diphospho-decaprenol L-rhamnosyltransferase